MKYKCVLYVQGRRNDLPLPAEKTCQAGRELG